MSYVQDELYDASADFTSDLVGSTVLNVSNGKSSRVVSVIDSKSLELEVDASTIFNIGDSYSFDAHSINFGSEFDERTNQIENDSLFEFYHKNYILNLYQADSRIVKITAHLPLSILLKYELNDRFIFRGKKYLINSVKTNLQTGKSDIELLSDNYGEE